MPAPLTREQECDRILEHYRGRFSRIGKALDEQFRTIHNRAEVLLGICGILISAGVVVTTGRLVRRIDFAYQPIPRALLVAAGSLDMCAAAILVGGVLRVRWITQQPGDDLRAWIMANLAYRDAKTRTYRVSIVLVLLAMFAYQVAIAMALAQL